MDDSEKPSLPPSLRDLIEQERRRLGPHPPVEDLVAYQAGELPAEKEERLRDHLALCPECAHLLLDLRDFPEISLPEGARRPSEAEVEAAWEALQPRLGEPRPAEKPAAVSSVQPSRPERWRAPSRWPASLAAVFFLSTVGLSFWGVSLQRRLHQPLPDPEVVDFVPKELERGRAEEQVLSASESTTLRVETWNDQSFPRYELSIQEVQTGKEVLRSPVSLKKTANFTLQLPPRFLAPGRYRLTLYGLRDGRQPESLEEFVFRVR